MTEEKYPEEVLNEDYDNGTMPANVGELRQAVVGHRIVSVETGVKSPTTWHGPTTVITLDNGHQVRLRDTQDCCASTELEAFLLHPEMVDHIIMGIGTTDGYTTWHIFADQGDILELTVGWSAGNPFWYGYGFDITVEDVSEGVS